LTNPSSLVTRVESQVVLASLRAAADLLRLLLDGGHSAKAGYLAGAFRQTRRAPLTDEIIAAMSGAGYDVHGTAQSRLQSMEWGT
jgi:hypothetical protein